MQLFNFMLELIRTKKGIRKFLKKFHLRYYFILLNRKKNYEFENIFQNMNQLVTNIAIYTFQIIIDLGKRY